MGQRNFHFWRYSRLFWGTKVSRSLGIPGYIVLFLCDWFDPSKHGTRVVHPEYKIVKVNARQLYQLSDTFVIAQQCRQVYFAEYPSNIRTKLDWRAIIKTKAIDRVELSDSLEMAYQNDDYERV